MFRAAAAAIVLLTLVRVAATHHVFSETFDENAHVAGGHEWLTSSTYRIDPTHPPLARILFAIPFRRIPPAPSKYIHFGHYLFGRDGRYVGNVAHARLGNLPFLALALIATGLWANRLFGRAAALVATLLLASMPPVLAQAGLATTDMAAAATLTLALYALDLWLEAPSWRRTIFLGVAAGLGLIAKFSFIPFFAIGAVVVLVARRRLPSARALLAATVAFVIVWTAYKFSWGTMEEEYHGMTKVTSFATTPLPAPAFFLGILAVKQHDERGHGAYLLGRNSTKGWWDYFPIALGVKTPIPLLIFFAIGAGLLIHERRRLELLLIVAAILAYCMTSSINIGVRHVLPLYPLLAIVGAYGAVWLMDRPLPRGEGGSRAQRGSRVRAALASIVLMWLVAGSALAHPDYLPWFNALAGREPYRVLVDSNFDWGQDVLRLARVCRERGISALGASLFTTADLRDAGLPPVSAIDWYRPASGWVAISETNLQVAVATQPRAFAWLTEGRPYERVGKSIRLYRVAQ
jgi:4-amino-4-deoxy-L-arabinose transferase-like glycosyltransferase